MIDLKTKLYQMFILGTEGGKYVELLQNGLGGIIFFTHDIRTVSQFASFVSQIKEISSVPPFLSIDQEGGRVERTENINNGKKYLSSKFAYEKGMDFSAEQTQNIANDLKFFGLNMNFAPCIDVNTNPKNPIIGERAFSSNPDDVIKAEKIVSKIYRDNGIIPCVKHFPGHGDASVDSHLGLPEINLTLEEMKKTHIKPFKSAIENGAEMVMVAHLHCKCFDKETIPTSLSKNAISYLRNNLNFRGVIISDDMMMGGVIHFGSFDQNCINGIKAGINMFICRYSDILTVEMIDKIYEEALKDADLKSKIENSYELITKLKNKYLLNS